MPITEYKYYFCNFLCLATIHLLLAEDHLIYRPVFILASVRFRELYCETALCR